MRKSLEAEPPELQIAHLEAEYQCLAAQISSRIQTEHLDGFLVFTKDIRDRGGTLFFDETGKWDHYAPNPTLEDILFRFADLTDEGFRAIQTAELTESNAAFHALDSETWEKLKLLHQRKLTDPSSLSGEEEDYLVNNLYNPDAERNNRYEEQKQKYLHNPAKRIELLEGLVGCMRT